MPRRRTAFRGRFSRSRSTVAGNTSRPRAPRAARDFPLYVGRQLTLRQEQKFIDTDFNFTGAIYAVANIPSIVMPELPPRGDSLSTRLGDRILLTSLMLRGRLVAPSVIANGEGVGSFVDLFVIHDKIPTGTFPVPGLLFTASSIAQGYGMLQDPSFRDRFSLLFRYRYQLNGCAKTSTATAVYQQDGDRTVLPIDLNLTLNKTMAFATTNSTGSLAAVVKGGLYLVAGSNQPLAGSVGANTNTFPYFNLSARLLFADL